MNALSMLFGAALVALGVLAAALADRIRGLRIAREERESTSRDRVSRAPAIPVVEAADLSRPKPRAPRAEPKAPASSEGGEDVVAALVAAGYKKAIASEAAWACSGAERTSTETWVAAALRRCARGGLS